MRLFLFMIPFLLLAASVTGCTSKSPADSTPLPGVIENPNRPDTEAIKSRKPMRIDSRQGETP